MSRQTDIFRYFNASNGTFNGYMATHGNLRLTDAELEDVRVFTEFNSQPASGHCTMCMRVLYPEEQKYRQLSEEWLICNTWNIAPIVNAEGLYMVCQYHLINDGTSSDNRRNTQRASEGEPLNDATPEKLKNQFAYPGDLQPLCVGLNYRELSVLSPIKLMTQMTRKGNLRSGRIGHYEVKGSVFTTHNFEFAEMAYGGTLGLFFQKKDRDAYIDKEKVRAAYSALQATHPLLARYNLEHLRNNLVNYHLTHNKEYIASRIVTFGNNMIMPTETPHAESVGHDIVDLVVATTTKKESIRYGHPSLLALTFPHLYTHCTGHYSLCGPKSEVEHLGEHEGGVSRASLERMTLAEYAKSRLLMRDRRFGKDPSFLFFVMDAIEKRNISGADLRIANTKNISQPRKKDFVTVNSDGSSSYKRSETSIVPPTIRTSYAYSRRKHLDVKTIFNNLGEPQLFLTFTCEDTSDVMKIATGLQRPWEDPVLFALHFKRKWVEFFEKYLLKKWGTKIGGINDYCWVMEIQDRGSPHIHCVLWTEKPVEQLIAQNIVSCRIPSAHYDSDLYQLVSRHQVHVHNDIYCKLENNTRPCRFGFPKLPAERTQFQGEVCEYERSIADENINNYNPYLLKMFRGNMDIQYNKGGKAAYYLAKYITKFDEVVEATIKRKTARGHFNQTTDVSARDHFKARLVGSIEASYHVCGWHTHGNSRSVTFLTINLPGAERRALRNDFLSLDDDDPNIFMSNLLEKYEHRDCGSTLTFPLFACYYTNNLSKADIRTIKDIMGNNSNSAYSFPLTTRPFFENRLPLYITSTVRGATSYFKLRKTKQAFWRTFTLSEADGESYYHQQIVINAPLPIGMTFKECCEGRTWRDYFRSLVDRGVIQVPSLNIENINQVNDEERGVHVAREELRVMYEQCFDSQRKIFKQVIEDLKLDSTVFVSGAAGTGKSFLLKMLERYYRIHGYHVCKLAPTGVAAYNINGQTIHRFFGISDDRSLVVDTGRLRAHVELYKKTLFLIDEYSMLKNSLLDSINSALLKTTVRNSPMGGIRTVFFGDFAQLPPVLKNCSVKKAREESLWNNPIYKHSNKYTLINYIRQRDESFLEVLELVRTGRYNKRVAAFIISRTVPKRDLPINCLRLYVERELAERNNENDLLAFPGDEITINAHDTYNCAEQTAYAALRETRLVRTLVLKIGIPVMLLRNVDVNAGWVNGTIATVFFADDNNIGLRKFANGQIVERWVQRITRTVPRTSYSRKQFPVIPAFAATIHKAQSATIDCVAIHLDNMKDHGQLYVAMSRVRHKEDLFFFGVDIPVNTKKRFRVDWDANEIVLHNLKRGKL